MGSALQQMIQQDDRVNRLVFTADVAVWIDGNGRVTQAAAPRAPRQSDVDARLFAAALAILRGRGPLSVSVEAVAAASGVAKTTIYRRYENRESLLTAAVNSTVTTVEFPEGMTARESLRWVLLHARDTI